MYDLRRCFENNFPLHDFAFFLRLLSCMKEVISSWRQKDVRFLRTKEHCTVCGKPTFPPRPVCNLCAQARQVAQETTTEISSKEKSTYVK